MALAVSGRESQQAVFSGLNELTTSRLAKYGSNARVMQQITSAYTGIRPLEYVFQYAPQSFTHQGYGININEIPRPYLSPIVDIVAGNARKANFEFTITTSEDGFFNSVDSEILYVQTFADNAIPVNFNGVHRQLNELSWYIESAEFTHNRANLPGQTTIATCQISLVEFTTVNKKLILLPRFKYGKITQTQKSGVLAPGATPDFQAAADQLIATTAKPRQETPAGNPYGG
jgi:hypothetical protein